MKKKAVIQSPVNKALEQQDPNVLLYDFLKQNKLKLDISFTDNGVAYVGDGFVLTDKPLIKVIAKYV